MGRQALDAGGTGTAFTLATAARLARGVTLARGEAGCLWETWADPAAVAYLRHLCALPDPDENPAAAAFLWHTAGDLLELDRPLLGVIVRGIDPIALAEGLEDLGTFASAVTPVAHQDAERTGSDLEPLLAAHLRRAVAAQVARWAPGVSYGLHDGDAAASLRPLDARPLREAQEGLEVQDHRNVVPIRPPPR